ncbi:MAG TPA: gamma carbonic anhydrase family protein [Chloroflexia bacterium]|nr:gamma carbonic anhydrase family protein [Chloroflexia bacterium]
MPLLPHHDRYPVVGRGCYIAPTAVLIGEVTIEDGASVWFGCVLRGDVSPIVVGARSNIQDNTVIHGQHGCPTVIGKDVTVGHSAIIHAATVGDRVLVGMGAVLLSRCRIGPDTIIGARALVTEDVEIPPGSLAVGMPARVRRQLTGEEREHILVSSRHYIEYAAQYVSEQEAN